MEPNELKATTAQEIVQNEKDCDYMDDLFGGVKMPPTQVYIKTEVDKVIAEKDADYKDALAKLEEQESLIKEMKDAAADIGLKWQDYDAGEDAWEDTHKGKWVKAE